MKELRPEQFSDFFSALHGHDPFPWQERLAKQVITSANPDSVWPQVMSLPTASGKTACLDIALFALACQADWGEQRTAPRRIFFVVDRRVIVDEAYERALSIKKNLTNENEILKNVSERLLFLAGEVTDDPAPLECFQLRGGIYRDDTWVKSPLQPTIIASTVDQIGSRLLFRSYGCSNRMAPIHAGLAGNDVLIFLDEAHCAKPFMETLHAVKQYREWRPPKIQSQSFQTPFHVVVMSATPPADVTEGIFKLADEDRNHPILDKRISASKYATLHVAPKNKTDDECINTALQLVSEEHKAIAIIVNRVDTARNIFYKLQDKKAIARIIRKEKLSMDDYDTELFIGRMRPIDRDKITKKWLDKLSVSQSKNRQLDKPIFIVATQCLEVGANLDFDAMVSECASLDALRQRFGRLNRLGIRENSPACIVIQEKDQKENNDPIYGNAIANTWTWLNKHKSDNKIDMGIQAMNDLLAKEEKLNDLLAPSESAPIMLPAHIDCWVQTEPIPQPDPDVSLFLHGPERGVPDVQVCWRADLPEERVDDNKIIETLSLCPPVSGECMQVPLYVLRNWLKGEKKVDDIYDVEGAMIQEEDYRNRQVDHDRWLVRWLGSDDSKITDKANDIRPGDTLVIPESFAGWELFGYLPKSDNESADVYDTVNLRQKGKPILRLHPALIKHWPEGDIHNRIVELIELSTSDEDELDIQAEVKECLNDLSESDEYPEELQDKAKIMINDKSFKVIPHPLKGWICQSKKKIKSSEYESYSTEDDLSSKSSQKAIKLDDHGINIENMAKHLTADVGLSTQLIDDLLIAVRFHDIGKVDPRFQAWLRNGNEMLAIAEGFHLAKSEGLPQSQYQRQRARERSGYPKGGRHELLSVRLIESKPEILLSTHDSDLVLHLIESHHGYCRPFAPVVDDPDPVEVEYHLNGHTLKAKSDTGLERLDSGVAERFWKLVCKYGWWGLAYLEALFRLADHRASEWEQNQTEDSMETYKS